MPPCQACSAEVAEGSRFCPSCAAPVATSSSDPTRASLETAQATRERRSPVSHPSLERARFAPGDVIDRRYRVVALLGRGGMGEVYRADDLKLGQPVALKFLPEELEADPGRLERFLNEARVARQVAHPNVCRVYDVAEGLARRSTTPTRLRRIERFLK